MSFSIWSFCREVLSKSSSLKAPYLLEIKRYIREMYGDNIPNNLQKYSLKHLMIFWPLVKFRQTRVQSSKIHVLYIDNAKCSIFGKSRESSQISQKTFLRENGKFLQYICPMYFLKNRNYDLFNLKFLPRGFVEIIRIQGLITPAN